MPKYAQHCCGYICIVKLSLATSNSLKMGQNVQNSGHEIMIKAPPLCTGMAYWQIYKSHGAPDSVA